MSAQDSIEESSNRAVDSRLPLWICIDHRRANSPDYPNLQIPTFCGVCAHMDVQNAEISAMNLMRPNAGAASAVYSGLAVDTEPRPPPKFGSGLGDPGGISEASPGPQRTRVSQ